MLIMQLSAVAYVHTDCSGEELSDGRGWGGIERDGRSAASAAALLVYTAAVAGVHGGQHGTADRPCNHQP